MNATKPQTLVSATVVKPILRAQMVSMVHTLATAMLVTSPMMPRSMTVLSLTNVPLMQPLAINTTIMPKQSCTNTSAASFTCTCNGPYWTGDGTTCTDVDEYLMVPMIVMVPTNFAKIETTVGTVPVPQVTKEQPKVIPTLNACRSPSATPPPVTTPTLLASNSKESTLVMVLMVLQTAVLVSHAIATLSSP